MQESLGMINNNVSLKGFKTFNFMCFFPRFSSYTVHLSDQMKFISVGGFCTIANSVWH